MFLHLARAHEKTAKNRCFRKSLSFPAAATQKSYQNRDLVGERKKRKIFSYIIALIEKIVKFRVFF